MTDGRALWMTATTVVIASAGSRRVEQRTSATTVALKESSETSDMTLLEGVTVANNLADAWTDLKDWLKSDDYNDHSFSEVLSKMAELEREYS